MNNRITGALLLGVLGALTLFSCTKDITVAQPPYTNRASGQCFIEPDSVPVLYLNATVPYFDPAVKKTNWSYGTL